MLRRLLPILGLLVVAAGAQTEDPIDRRMEACIRQDSTTAGMVRCTEAALEAWDEEMNRVCLDPRDREALRAAQRAWLGSVSSAGSTAVLWARCIVRWKPGRGWTS